MRSRFAAFAATHTVRFSLLKHYFWILLHRNRCGNGTMDFMTFAQRNFIWKRLWVVRELPYNFKISAVLDILERVRSKKLSVLQICLHFFLRSFSSAKKCAYVLSHVVQEKVNISPRFVDDTLCAQNLICFRRMRCEVHIVNWKLCRVNILAMCLIYMPHV